MGMGPSPGTSLGPGGATTATDGAASPPERRCTAITAEEARPSTLRNGTRNMPPEPASERGPNRFPRSRGQAPKPKTGPEPNRDPYPPDESPRADAGLSVRNPQSAIRMQHPTSPASAGVFRKETSPGRTAGHAEPAAAPRTAQRRNPSGLTRTGGPLRRTRPSLRPPEKRKPAPHPANHSGPSTPPFAIHRPHPHRGTALRRTPMPHRSGTPPTAPSPSQQRLTCAGEPPRCGEPLRPHSIHAPQHPPVRPFPFTKKSPNVCR